MAGIYIHIPFCSKACHYCNFHFSTSLKLKNDFIQALLKEIEITAGAPPAPYLPNDHERYLKDEEIETIYFGGGTPSLLSGDELNAILSNLKRCYKVQPNAEITLEANPDDISTEKLACWKQHGINRLSIGIQSFFDEDLLWMNRAHNSSQSLSAIQLAQQQGFDNITIDLIYGTPSLTDEKWKYNVDTAIQAAVPHLSCYGLTVEPSTALEKMIRDKKLADVSPEKQAHQYTLLMEWLEAAGYEHYEISNFAKPGKRSRHNSAYWLGKSYLGLGPSAHSFNGVSRRWNVANNALYIQSINNNQLPVETENLTVNQQINEYLMTALRTIEGVNLQHLVTRFGNRVSQQVEIAAKKYIRDGKLQANNEKLLLTRKGKLFADGIAADLFI
jgi:oxygen-independent coproporphyrinogen III oxidase